MNLINFLKETDALAAKYSAEQLALFIHDIARILPEERRLEFLKRLKSVDIASENTPADDRMKTTGFNDTFRQISKNLSKIDSQELTITRILNEEYDDWYDDGSREFFYKDESGISDMLAEACDFVHTCVDEEMYKEGLEIGRQLFYMEILCEGDYGDEELSIGDMVHHELLSCNMKRVILDTLYCAYYAASLKKRPEVLYEIIANAGDNEISLESVMQHGDKELPDFEEFLTEWIIYLGDKKGRDADRLIPEAVSLLNDVSAAYQYAGRFADTHPGLYLHILENEKSANLKTMVSIGIQAMKTIPGKYVIRSRVALKTADYIIMSGKQQDLLEMCYFAAYKSDTTVMNYFRALLNGYEDEMKREELRQVLMSFPANENDAYYGTTGWNASCSERTENKPDRNTLLMLRFFDGQFAEVLAKGLNTTKALGWTGTFMKQGIALYLLCIYEGEWNKKGIAAMADIVKKSMGFSAEEYNKGLIKNSGTNDNALFYNLFLKWKSMVVMDPDTKAGAIKKIEALLEKRTEGIMNANRRNYYGECAAYIAALGEVHESLGDKGAKQRLMTSYKNKYSRRNAFRADMKYYGWDDGKKK